MTLRDQLSGIDVSFSLSLGDMSDTHPSTKAEADYRRSRDGKDECQSCSHFSAAPDYTAPGSCSLVSGAIDPTWTCDYYDAAPGERKPSMVRTPKPERGRQPGGRGSKEEADNGRITQANQRSHG